MILLLSVCVAVPAYAGVSAWIPFENRDGHIAIDIKIAGQAATAIIDSGSQIMGISEAFLEAHPKAWQRGSKVILTGAFGKRTANLANNLAVELFGVSMELDDVAPLQTSSVDSIIGLGFFLNFIVQLDYPNHRMRVIEHGSLNLGDVDNVKMRLGRGSVMPLVQVNMNDEYSPWLILDTGSTGGVLISRSRAEMQGWLERFATDSSTAEGVNTVADLEHFRLPEMTFGPYKLADVLVEVPAAGHKLELGRFDQSEWSTGTRIKKTKQADGILGYDVLQHFVLTIDYQRGLLHIATSAE